MFDGPFLLAAMLMTLVAGASCASPARPVTEGATVRAEARPVTFIEDDLPGAQRRASEQKKLLFVDAWAPWCHTCLSMRDVVLKRPELARFERTYVFVALDTDREDSAAFLERYRMRVWPTFFVLAPESGSVLAMHGGALSLEELTALLDAGVQAQRAGPDQAPGAAVLARAHQAYVDRDFARAGALYEEAATLVENARRAEALVGAVRAFSEAGDPARCTSFGTEHLAAVSGAAAPVDFVYYVRDCAQKLPEGQARASVQAALRTRIFALVESPPAGASVDDRADAHALAAEIAREEGDKPRADALETKRLVLLEEAAGRARTPVEAQVYDYERMGALLALDRAEAAVALLEERTRQLPDSYEAHARLAQARIAANDLKGALAAIDRAIALAYGPRRLGYLARKADVLGKLGDKKAQIETLKAEVAGWAELPSGHQDAARLADAEKRLGDAEAAAGSQR